MWRVAASSSAASGSPALCLQTELETGQRPPPSTFGFFPNPCPRKLGAPCPHHGKTTRIASAWVPSRATDSGGLSARRAIIPASSAWRPAAACRTPYKLPAPRLTSRPRPGRDLLGCLGRARALQFKLGFPQVADGLSAGVGLIRRVPSTRSPSCSALTRCRGVGYVED